MIELALTLLGKVFPPIAKWYADRKAKITDIKIEARAEEQTKRREEEIAALRAVEAGMRDALKPIEAHFVNPVEHINVYNDFNDLFHKYRVDIPREYTDLVLSFRKDLIGLQLEIGLAVELFPEEQDERKQSWARRTQLMKTLLDLHEQLVEILQNRLGR